MSSTEQFEKHLTPEREKNKEKKEAEVSAEDRVAASKERADYLVKEVKNSQQQMQNILLHMAEVKKIIKQIRDELQLAHAPGTDNSLREDDLRIKKLQQRIATYQEEILKMRDDLIRAEIDEIQKRNPQKKLSQTELSAEATQAVDTLIQNLQQ